MLRNLERLDIVIFRDEKMCFVEVWIFLVFVGFKLGIDMKILDLGILFSFGKIRGRDYLYFLF